MARRGTALLLSARCAPPVQPPEFGYASHLVQAGVPLIFMAEALGHSDARMVTKHYGHLAPSHVADAIRAALPKFGPVSVPADNVTDLRAVPHGSAK